MGLKKITHNIDIQKAINFVRMKGNELEQARLNKILGQDFDSAGVLKGFSILQNPDGGFPYGDRPGFPSCLSNTAQAVHVLQELELEDSDIYRSATRFIIDMQRDGIWPENEKIAPLSPPSWDSPGDDRTTLWLTADITDLLLRSSHPKEELKLAIDYIAEFQAPDGKFMGFIHTTWMALSIFGNNGDDNETVYSEALGYLENCDLEGWDATCIAWCLDCMKNGNVPGDSSLWERLLDKLAELQDEQGSWPAEEGEHLKSRNSNSVLATLQYVIDYS